MTYSYRCQHCNGQYCTAPHQTCQYCVDNGVSAEPMPKGPHTVSLDANGCYNSGKPECYPVYGGSFNGIDALTNPFTDTDLTPPSWMDTDPWGESVIQPREIIPIDVGQWQPSAETIKWELPAHEEFDLKYVTGIPVEQLIADPSFDPISAVVNEPSPFFESVQCSSEVTTWSLPSHPFATQGRLLADLQSLGESILADDLNDNTPLIADDQQMQHAVATGEGNVFVGHAGIEWWPDNGSES